jgi:hypothetical protein
VSLNPDTARAVVAGDLTIYKRTAIVLYRQEDDLKLKLALKGDKWALEELHRRTKKNGKPDAYARRIASALLEKLSVSTRSLYPSYTGSSDHQTLQNSGRIKSCGSAHSRFAQITASSLSRVL